MKRLGVLSALAVLFLYGGLFLSLAWFIEPTVLGGLLSSPRTLAAIRLSLGAATVATLIAILVATPAAYALSRYPFPGRGVVDTLLEFPIIVSPAALGAILLIFFTNPAGEWVQESFVRFVFTPAGIVLAQFVTILGVAVRTIKTAFDEVPVEMETVARTLGAPPHRIFTTVTLPLARNGMIAAFIICWAKAMGEFGATLMVAGTMAMRTETLPIAIFMRLSTADIEGSVALILVLILIGLSSLFIARRFLERRIDA